MPASDEGGAHSDRTADPDVGSFSDRSERLHGALRHVIQERTSFIDARRREGGRLRVQRVQGIAGDQLGIEFVECGWLVEEIETDNAIADREDDAVLAGLGPQFLRKGPIFAPWFSYIFAIAAVGERDCMRCDFSEMSAQISDWSAERLPATARLVVTRSALRARRLA